MTELIKTIDLENIVLGCAINSPKAQPAVLELTGEDMATATGADILAAMQFMHREGKKIDLVTLDAQTAGKYTAYLAEAAANAYTPSRHGEYIEALMDRARKRRITMAAHRLVNAMTDPLTNTGDAVEEFNSEITTMVRQGERTISAGEATMRLVEGFERRDEKRAYTGIPALDEELGGVFGGKLMVVGARPATGKSALALSAAMLTQASGTVLFCSYEMAPEELMGRAVSCLSGVDNRAITTKELTTDDYIRMGEVYGRAANLDIRFTTEARTPAKVRTEAMKIKTLSLIVIDYLQLMNSGQRAETRRVEVGQISRALKELALELRVPVLALSQLNRQSEAKADREPDMSELRESGDIEQDADIIVLMYHPKDAQNREERLAEKGCKSVRLGLYKNRQGRVGCRIDTAFDGAHMRFVRIGAVLGGEEK